MQSGGINVAEGASGLVFPGELGAKVHSQHSGLGNVDIHICAEVEPPVIHLGIVSPVIRNIENTVFEVIGSSCVVADIFGTADNGDIGLAGRCSLLEDLMDPVYVGVNIFIKNREGSFLFAHPL